MSRSKFWTLTLFDYSDEDLALWKSLQEEGKADYICFQEETCPTSNRPHLQGYVVFPKRLRLPGLKKLFKSTTIHAVLSNGSPSSNRTYCSKAGGVPDSFFEAGQIPDDPVPGKRNDFEAFKEAVNQGLCCKKRARAEFPDLVAKYPRWCYDFISDQSEISVPDHALYEWQTHLLRLLEEEPDDRHVIFVVDPDGNQGKTWLAKKYVKEHDNAQFLEPAKKSDMAYALQDSLRVLFLNVTRTPESERGDKHDYLYSFIESVKNGMVFCSKYESRMKMYGNVHVVVMMNNEPNMELLSTDRYIIIRI